MKEYFITLGTILILGLVTWNLFAYRDLKYIENNAPKYLESLGYEVIGTDGYTGSYTYGANVFYQVKRTENKSLLYSISVVEWRGELQSWRPEVINSNIVLE